ncbi:MAG: transglutaminase domain-containing protein [Candidatus Methylomirabilales bacterium]
MKKSLLVVLVVVVATSAAFVAYRGGWGTKFLPVRAAISEAVVVEISKRGPGMKGPGTDSLKLPVPRTFDLTHVDPVHFAVALGKDPTKIFEFVRDQIAYEVYTGSLRGPRGTLLAMAGNSVDRAALLASMLQHAGHRVRYVRGTLPEREAKELVTSMWAERPRAAEPKVASEPSPALKAAFDTLVTGVKRDYTLIREHLKKANITPSAEAAPSLEFLVKEAQPHYWVQWWKDGTWVDLDPSFADATPGRKYAPVAEAFDALPDALFHRVNIRVRLEEYSVLLEGDGQVKPASRDILTYTAKAADLSGIDLVLSHQPENWKGPATSLQEAIASAITSTGRVRPVLLLGGQDWRTGEPFRQKPPTGVGIGGITDLLGGAGTRKPVPVATAETIEFDFISPGGRKETVVREIFDVVGKARRAARRNLNAAEVRARTTAESAFDVTRAAYDLFFATGRVDAVHVLNVAEDSPTDSRTLLQGINIAFIVTSDGLLASLELPDGEIVLLYPHSPRLVIAELSVVAEKERLAFDLRRDDVRAVALGPHPKDLFLARIFRGIVNGTLERVLLESLIASTNESGVGPVFSTSLLFERAHAEGVPTALLTRDRAHLGAVASEDARTWVQEDLDGDYLVVAPEREIALRGELRFAWWRIDRQSGHTIAVTDEGLYTAEFAIVEHKTTGKVKIVATSRDGTVAVMEGSAKKIARIASTLLRYGYRFQGRFTLH